MTNPTPEAALLAIAAVVLIALAARWYSAQLDKLDELVDESGEHL